MITHYIPFNQIDKISKIDLDESNLYLTNLYLVSILNTVDLPIERTKATKRILRFFRYIQATKQKDSTINIPVSCEFSAIHNIERFFTRDTYKAYLKIFSDLGLFVEVLNDNNKLYTSINKNSKCETNQCKKYLVSELLDNELVVVYFDNYIKYTNSIDNQVKGLDRRYVKTIKTLKVNILDAYQAELGLLNTDQITNKKFISRINRLFNFPDEARYIKYGDTVNRIYHNVSNLSSTQREHTNVKFNYVDIPNAQPLILLYLLKQNGFAYDRSYEEDCINANLYERFYNRNYVVKTKVKVKDDNGRYIYNKEGKLIWKNAVESYTVSNLKADRDVIKEQLFRSIYFDFKPKSGFNQAFNEYYPTTWKSFNSLLEANKNTTSANLLQNLEASIINPIQPTCSTHYYTLFDGIYYEDSNDTNSIITEIKSTFNNMGVDLKMIECNHKKEVI